MLLTKGTRFEYEITWSLRRPRFICNHKSCMYYFKIQISGFNCSLVRDISGLVFDSDDEATWDQV